MQLVVLVFNCEDRLKSNVKNASYHGLSLVIDMEQQFKHSVKVFQSFFSNKMSLIITCRLHGSNTMFFCSAAQLHFVFTQWIYCVWFNVYTSNSGVQLIRSKCKKIKCKKSQFGTYPYYLNSVIISVS